MKVVIINFNRLTLMKNLAEWCAANNLDVIILDNNSDYPPLLDYYASCPFKVHRINANYGHTVFWNLELYPELIKKGKYILTDSDLDLSGVPGDFLKVMEKGLDIYARFPKCGLSLEINDLPNLEQTQKMKNECEIRYWQQPLSEIYFDAPVDTTFALYRENVRTHFLKAIRTNRPYTARHVPWYYTDFNSLPEDEKYYFQTANASSSGKSRIMT